MQRNPGYVYVLFNQSAEGLVKIGKTTKDPEERAKELSSGTGVPTPFIVVYQAYFQDYSAAETFVHTLLHDNRVSDNKEFFRISTTEAIKAIVEAERTLNKVSSEEVEIESDQLVEGSTEESESTGELGEEIMNIADEHYYGFGDTLKDYEEARKYYLKAANLGYSEAYLKLGDIYKNGEGVTEDKKKAIKYYKLGAQNGDVDCWGEMAIIYSELNEKGNADKCWRKIFNISSIHENPNLGRYAEEFIDYMDERSKYKDLFKKFDVQVVNTDLEEIYLELKDSIEPEWIFEKGGKINGGVQVDTNINDLPLSSDIPLEDWPSWLSIYKKADNYCYGNEDTPKNHEQAFKLFKESAKIGCPFAFRRIGEMYFHGEGCEKDHEKALQQFRLGVNQGDDRCWGDIAHLYFYKHDFDKMGKCWKNYFESEHFRNNITYEDTSYNNIVFAARYLLLTYALQESNFLSGVEFKPHLIPIRKELIDFFSKTIRTMEENPSLATEKNLIMQNKILSNIRNWD